MPSDLMRVLEEKPMPPKIAITVEDDPDYGYTYTVYHDGTLKHYAARESFCQAIIDAAQDAFNTITSQYHLRPIPFVQWVQLGRNRVDPEYQCPEIPNHKTGNQL